MKTRPIIFSGPMVRAILEGRKTMTRRVVKPQPDSEIIAFDGLGDGCFNAVSEYGIDGRSYPDTITPQTYIECPYGQPGDRLWVRETWAQYGLIGPAADVGGPWPDREVIYRATDQDGTMEAFWRPSIHMPRWASRIALEVVGVRVERVQEIEGEGACAEGYPDRDGDRFNPGKWLDGLESNGAEYSDMCDSVTWFRHLWDSINAKRGYPWSDEDLPDNLKTGHGRVMYGNPWVWVVEFKRAEQAGKGD